MIRRHPANLVNETALLATRRIVTEVVKESRDGHRADVDPCREIVEDRDDGSFRTKNLNIASPYMLSAWNASTMLSS